MNENINRHVDEVQDNKSMIVLILVKLTTALVNADLKCKLEYSKLHEFDVESFPCGRRFL